MAPQFGRERVGRTVQRSIGGWSHTEQSHKHQRWRWWTGRQQQQPAERHAAPAGREQIRPRGDAVAVRQEPQEARVPGQIQEAVRRHGPVAARVDPPNRRRGAPLADPQPGQCRTVQ